MDAEGSHFHHPLLQIYVSVYNFCAAQVRPEDNETYTFKWQQKLFSSREVDLYRDLDNCNRPVEEKYHREIAALYEGEGRPTTRLFSYVDHDTFASIQEV